METKLLFIIRALRFRNFLVKLFELLYEQSKVSL